MKETNLTRNQNSKLSCGEKWSYNKLNDVDLTKKTVIIYLAQIRK